MPCVIAIIPKDNGVNIKDGDVFQEFESRINDKGQVEVAVGIDKKTGEKFWSADMGNMAHKQFLFLHVDDAKYGDFRPEPLLEQVTNVDYTKVQLPVSVEMIKDERRSLPIIKSVTVTKDSLYAVATDRVVASPKPIGKVSLEL